MFENDFTINGKHATYIKYLVNEAKVFERYIDVYLNGVVWGLLYARTSSKDNSSDRARIYADAFAKERDNCVFLYRLTMLLDETTKLSPEERVDRAFRDDAKVGNEYKLSENLEIFHSYVFGGIEVLYEKYTDGCITQDDFVNRIFDLMQSFKEEINGASYEDKLASLLDG